MEERIIYMLAITHDRLIGEKDCEIRYVHYLGNYDVLWRIARIRNINLTQISLSEFKDGVREQISKKIVKG